jgi:hypothetical protein
MDVVKALIVVPAKNKSCTTRTENNEGDREELHGDEGDDLSSTMSSTLARFSRPA